MTGFATPVAPGKSGADNSIFDPRLLTEVIGQQTLVRQLIPEIRAAIHEDRAVCSMLFHGAAGLGKSAIAKLIGACRGVNVVTIQGSSADSRTFDTFFRCRPSPNVGERSMIDLTGYELMFHAGQSKPRWERHGRISPTVLVIEEGDGIKKQTWQNLQDAMPPGDSLGNLYYQTVIGGERRDVFAPQFTPVITTNYADQILRVAAPLVSRCAIKYRFEPYTENEIAQILQQFATKADLTIDPAAATLLAEKAGGVPRAALQHFAKARAQLSSWCAEHHTNSNAITLDMVKGAYEAFSIDAGGLDPAEREYMLILFGADQKTLPLERIANKLGDGTKTIEALIEPGLYRRGLVQTAAGRGRQLTRLGVEYCHALQQNNPKLARDLPTDLTVDGRY